VTFKSRLMGALRSLFGRRGFVEVDNGGGGAFVHIVSGNGVADVTVSTVAGNKSLPGVTITATDMFPGKTLLYARLVVKIRTIVETSSAGVNKMNGAANIRLTQPIALGTVTAYQTQDDEFRVSSGGESGGDVLVGWIDIKAYITELGTYALDWLNATADRSNLVLYDVTTFLEMTWE